MARPATPPRGVVAEVLGAIDDPGVDTEIILRKHAIPDEHRRKRLPKPSASAPGRRAGHRRPHRFPRSIVVTIDGEHARDFDDAIRSRRLPNGHYWLGVHIADVAHYVRRAARSIARPTSAARRSIFPSAPSTCFP